jgi:DNA-binding Xre family transcriptional regulator
MFSLKLNLKPTEMLRIDVNRLLKMRGIEFGAVWLSKRGMSYKQAARITSGKMKTISLELLYKLCKAFKCTPNELLAYEPDGNAELDFLKPLKRTAAASPQDVLNGLSQEEIERVLEEMRRMKGK